MDVYLDHNATTPALPGVVDAMSAALKQPGNASSVHRYGRLVRRMVDDAREAVARLVGASAGNVIFTSGGTEANNLALRGFSSRALVSAVEHESVLAARDDVTRVPVDQNGLVNLDQLKILLRDSEPQTLISVMCANNETGVIQPIAQVTALAHEYGALVHCDAVQAAGKMPVSIEALGVDMLTLSAHKLGGPQGVGALILRAGLDPEPLLRGGGQERRRRAGTENMPGIAGFGAAAAAVLGTELAYSDIACLRDAMERRILDVVPDAVIYGGTAARLANTSCIGLPGVTGEMQVMTFDLAGVAVSAGSACSSGKVSPSHVLQAMGQNADNAKCAIRVSLGRTTTPAEIDRFVDVWAEMARRRQSETGAQRSVG